MTRLRVHVRVHSGRPDPVVELDGEDAAALLDALAPAAEAGRDDPGPPPPWHLGYRGLRVEQLDDPDPRLPARFEFGTDALRGPALAHRVAEPETDERLLAADGVLGRALPGELVELMPELIRAARAAPRAPADEEEDPDTTLGDALGPDLSWWNDENVGPDAHQYFNNCYNYATNVRTDTFAQPGRGSGLSLSSYELAHVYAWFDNVYDAPAGDNVTPIAGHLVALALAPTIGDYHWWRKNDNGYWSHKPGQTPATTKDASGASITDPRTCDRGVYTEWVGFMVAVNGRVRPA
jgi:hypothetical protein